MANKISLCMMVHNEEKTLGGAIASVSEVVDEVVIGVDEASTDKTFEVAKKLASPGCLFTFQWRDDFAAIRNETIKRATGDMILILDGHEYIAPNDHPSCPTMARIRRVAGDARVPTPLTTLAHIKENGLIGGTVVCCFSTLMNTDPAGIPQLWFLQPRLFMNHQGIHYDNAVHNALAGYDRSQTSAYRDVLLIHNMPAEREEKRKIQRKAMNAAGLYRDVQAVYRMEREYREAHSGEEPPLDSSRGRPFFYMGNTYADQGQYKQAIYWYERYLPRSGFGDEKYQAHQQLAVLEFRVNKDVRASFAHAQEAELLNDQRAEPCILRAEICQEQKDWAQAIRWLDKAETVTPPDTVMFMQGPIYSYLPSFQRARCYYEMGKWAESIGELEKVLSWRPGDPEVVKRIIDCRNKLRRQQDKPNLLLVDRMGSFTAEIGQHFANREWATVKRESCDERWKGWADVAWFEWCDANVVEWSQQPWPDCAVICRLHSYEAYTPEPGRVVWENVDHLIFVSDHIRRLVFERFPDIPKRVKWSVIPNGVDETRFTFRKRGHGRKIAFLGYINSKKAPDGLITLARMYPDYEFHVAGEPQELNVWDDFRYQIAGLHNVWFHGWQRDPNAWLEDMDYLVSPSVIEGFGYTIAQAALKGIKPLVRDRIGAAELWPKDWIYRGPEDLGRLLDEPYESEAYRQWIVGHYSLARQMTMTQELVDGLLADKRKVPTEKWAGFNIITKLDLGTPMAEGIGPSATTAPVEGLIV